MMATTLNMMAERAAIERELLWDVQCNEWHLRGDICALHRRGSLRDGRKCRVGRTGGWTGGGRTAVSRHFLCPRGASGARPGPDQGRNWVRSGTDPFMSQSIIWAKALTEVGGGGGGGLWVNIVAAGDP